MKYDMTLDDARLAARLAHTLDQAAQAPDPAWDARVDALIQRSRPAPAGRRWQWSGGLALAASVAFVAVLPAGWLDAGSPQAVGTSSAVDGQMVEEIDWLLAMEEASRGGR